LTCEAWCKKFPNVDRHCKGKSLHVHKNNKNGISKNQNGMHTHCFLIQLNKFKNKIKNTQVHGLTPKGRSSFFSKNTSKLPFLAQKPK
jgi:hypothetical protein